MLMRCAYLLLGMLLTLAFSQTLLDQIGGDAAEAQRIEMAKVRTQVTELAGAVQFLKRQVRYMDPTQLSYFPRSVPMDFASAYPIISDDAQETAVFYEENLSDTMTGLAAEVWALSDEVDHVQYKSRERKKMFREKPFLRPAQGWFSSHFGWRRSPTTGRRAYHKGVDLAAMPGTNAVAPSDGKIKFAGRRSGYGKVVMIDHGHDVVTILGHLGKIKVRTGAEVKRGQVVGKVGSTGSSTGYHLHYEVMVEGKQVNPWPFLEFKPEREGPVVCDPDEI